MSEKNITNSFEELTEQFYGFEYEEFDENGFDEESEQPFDADKIRIDQQMLSLKYLYDLMEDGQIELNPGFQRYRVWNEKRRKSLLIESLMLRIPIPAFYFYENDTSRFIVIDGQQRLSTIREFINDEYKLTGLEYLNKQCGGKKFSELDTKYQQRIFRTQLAVNILDARSPSNVIFDIFRRVNTGGVSLKPQEIRNAIAKHRTRAFLKDLYFSNEFQRATRHRIKDERMDGQEMVLRFIAFYRAYNFQNKYIEYHSGDLASFLDMALLELNNSSNTELANYADAFKRAMKNATTLFGEFAFRKSYLDNNSKVYSNIDIINKALFTSWGVILADPNLDDVTINSMRIKVLLALADTLTNDYTYNTCLTQGTNSSRSVSYAFYKANQILEAIIYDK